MRGKTVVITGGTSGIGEVAAATLARMGARIVLIARDKIRADATLARLRDTAPGIAHAVHFADLFVLRACELSGFGPTSINAFLKDGRLEAVRVPGVRRTLVSYASLERLLAPQG
jgi:NAD(P)-dependent dehydrogenase (short-subunit alcohol dehydrogenase family)